MNAEYCFPFRLTTVWSCGGVKTFDFQAYLANGVYVEPLNPPGAPPCPPACKFAGAELNGPGAPSPRSTTPCGSSSTAASPSSSGRADAGGSGMMTPVIPI
jgi:hypothetical protein